MQVHIRRFNEAERSRTRIVCGQTAQWNSGDRLVPTGYDASLVASGVTLIVQRATPTRGPSKRQSSTHDLYVWLIARRIDRNSICRMTTNSDQQYDASVSVPTTLRAVRIVAWLCAIGAFLTVIGNYEQLPDVLPVSRWTGAPRSWILALRVPIINACMLGMAEAFSRSLQRIPSAAHLWKTAAILLATAGIKCVLEAAELMLLPSRHVVLTATLVLVLVVGLSAASLTAMQDLKNRKWRQLRATPAENLIIAVMVGCVVAMNLPLIAN